MTSYRHVGCKASLNGVPCPPQLRKDNMKEATRVFFVVDSPQDNEEIYETLEEAEAYQSKDKRIRIAIVQNAYKEANGSWNYEDLSNTFDFVKEIK
jgi:hypothetical protein